MKFEINLLRDLKIRKGIVFQVPLDLRVIGIYTRIYPNSK